MKPNIETFFEPATWTVSYVVFDEVGGSCAIVDPVLDYDAIFIGDTLFMPDVGTARADFPGGDAHQLFQSIRKLLAFPSETRLFMCHDYPPTDRAIQWQSTVAEQRAHNIHVHDGISEDDFVAMRTARDTSLDLPTLLLP